MIGIFVILLGVSGSSVAEDRLNDVFVHPPYEENYTCSDHSYNDQAGDVFRKTGTDCVIVRMHIVGEKKFLKIHSDEGLRNENYYGWRQPVLSPCDCVVKEISKSNKVNVPGLMGNRDEVGYVSLISESGISFILAHLGKIFVSEGQRVSAGSKIGLVGNNGMSRAPHVHIVGWKDDEPLQIRFNPKLIGTTKPSTPDA